jgi:RNA-binding protein
MKSLTPAQRQYLKGLAHTRQPVVMIGNQGLTAAVLKEIDLALSAHELIKVKAASNEPDTRSAWLDEICAATGAASVQQNGKVLVIYRAAAKPVIILPG